MPRDGYPDVFSRNLSKKLPVHRVSLETDLLIFYVGLSTAEIGIRRKFPSARSLGSGGSYRLSQRGSYFIGVEVNFRFWLRLGRSRWRIRGRWCLVISARRRRSLLHRLLEVFHLLSKRLSIGGYG